MGPCAQPSPRQCRASWEHEFAQLTGTNSEECLRHHGKSQQSVCYIPSTVFSAPGVQDPAAVLRLLILLAGDIESNPGPTIQSRKCDSCTKAIRQPKPPATNKSPPLHCKQIGCTNVCHRIPKCSKISRYTSKPTWLCTLHNPNTPPSPPTSACACSLTPANPPANACSLSTNHACPTSTPDDAPKRKCFKCKGPIRTDNTPLYCSHCKRPFHGSCTKLTRDAIDEAHSELVDL